MEGTVCKGNLINFLNYNVLKHVVEISQDKIEIEIKNSLRRNTTHFEEPIYYNQQKYEIYIISDFSNIIHDIAFLRFLLLESFLFGTLKFIFTLKSSFDTGIRLQFAMLQVFLNVLENLVEKEL